MTNLQAGKSLCEEYSELPSGQHPLLGSPQNYSRQSRAQRTASNNTAWNGSPTPQSRRHFTTSASERERRYLIRRPLISAGPTTPPNSKPLESRSVFEQRLRRHPKEGQEEDDRMKFEEAPQRHGRRYPGLRASVEGAPATPISLTSEGPPDQGYLHQREHVAWRSPSNVDAVETKIVSPERISPEMVQRYDRQLELFRKLERLCTAAAQHYWRSQCHSSFSKPAVHRRPRLRRAQRESGPYPTGRIPSPPQHSFDSCLSEIARTLYERAEGPAQEVEAVHRMGNLYGWSELILDASRGGDLEIATEEVIFGVVIAAFEMTSWMLHQKSKEEIVRILANREWALDS
ncbi:hypothetical protein MMC15_003424 [Xylographa vitiligo]|nr:hypothetical protein [Xylographa vitiligo]